MPRHIHLEPYLSDDEFQKRYRAADDPVERSHWHFLWLLADGMTATAVAAVTSYTGGPNSMRDRRHAICTGRPHAPAVQLPELGAAMVGPHPDGDRWCGRTIA